MSTLAATFRRRDANALIQILSQVTTFRRFGLTLSAQLPKLMRASALGYSTYFGGEGFEVDPLLPVDDAGNIIPGGDTDSLTRTGPTRHPRKGLGQRDIFIVTFDPTGRGPLWSTYFGGEVNALFYGLAVDDRRASSTSSSRRMAQWGPQSGSAPESRVSSVQRERRWRCSSDAWSAPRPFSLCWRPC